ncbi:MAG TPA: ABC transporter permease [Anaerolineales bacterium]|jgi:ABC-type lipoprotein release transport system permease subunit|nr:ABC transporter permease [Anaerolineales bacterium]HQX15986.1 ABC transporter permease [Anaerolineales bacterium]
MSQLFKLAYRNIGRNKTRSLLSALAVAGGMALLLLMVSVMEGEMRGALTNTIRLQSGHLQIRPASYEEGKTSLKWDDLIADPEAVAQTLKTLPEVITATPRLIASGILSLSDESKGVQIIGVDPLSNANQPFREGLIAGEFIRPEDREGIMIGNILAEKLKLAVGDAVNLLVNTSNGDVDQQLFTIRGIFTTRTPGFDELNVLMPISKAQAFTATENHASAIFVLLHENEQAEPVARAIQSSLYKALTWQEQNQFVAQFEDYAGAFMIVLYLIVLGITATVVTNTLVMAVFERAREIGILAAIGMKGSGIMAQFLTEAALLATGGVIGGLLIGGAMVAYFTINGIYIGDYGITGVLFEDRIYAHLTLENTVVLGVVTYIITLAASLYPAMLAARMEPVEALHGMGG